MNQNLQNIWDFLQTDKTLSEEQKNVLNNLIKDADKEMEIISFKLDRTEKVKRTTAILLEETIEELEQKRKAVEAQNRELGIESALEKVRSSALAMKKQDDMVEVCRIISNQMQILGVNDIRNVQTAIFNKSRGTYMNYEFYEKHNRIFITETTYTNNKIHKAFALKMLKGKGEFFSTHIKGDKVKEWIAYQKTTNVFIDKFLNTASSLSYYWFSLGPVALGISTYRPLTEMETDLFKRFLKVFELAYRRFVDIEIAVAQAKEAKIEVALEKIRSSALAMQTSQQLKDVASELRNQMRVLGQEDLEVCAINLYDVDEKYFESWGAIRTRDGIEKLFEGNSRFPKSGVKIVDEMMHHYNKGTRDYVLVNEKEKAREWIAVLKEYSPEAFEMIRETIAIQKTDDLRVYWSLADFDGGAILMVTYSEPESSSRDLLRRTANVFELAYRRFQDLKTAEAHTEKAKFDLVQIQTEKKRAEEALAELQATQKQLIHAEKMASLGELTAGIAHEIQNPLNFVNNFSEVSAELVVEMKQELAVGSWQLAGEIADDIKSNLDKINHHGKRADAIVKGMLQHSRTSTGQKEPTDINALADEYLRLAYHGLRAKDKDFNAVLETDFDVTIGKINIIPQEIGRVILNLITNAFYAVDEKKRQLATNLSALSNLTGQNNYEPTVSVSTKKTGNNVLISVKDNGNGISQKILDKIFQPFFTTKPTGQGTGLGLSLSYDIVKAHGGELKCDTAEGGGSTFAILLPLK